MALTPAQLESIRSYFVLPAREPYLTNISNACAGLTPHQEATAIAHLHQISRLEKQLTQTVPFAAQSFSSGAGGTNQYVVSQRLEAFRMDARTHITNLAVLLDLRPGSDYFASSTPQRGQASTNRG